MAGNFVAAAFVFELFAAEFVDPPIAFATIPALRASCEPEPRIGEVAGALVASAAGAFGGSGTGSGTFKPLLHIPPFPESLFALP